VSSIKLITH